jgi:DNA-directed RNA polymerase subunit K/omega
MKKDTRDSKARVAAHRARLRAAGLRPIEVWSAPEYHARIREFVRGITRLTLAPDATPDILTLPPDPRKP